MTLKRIPIIAAGLVFYLGALFGCKSTNPVTPQAPPENNFPGIGSNLSYAKAEHDSSVSSGIVSDRNDTAFVSVEDTTITMRAVVTQRSLSYQDSSEAYSFLEAVDQQGDLLTTALTKIFPITLPIGSHQTLQISYDTIYGNLRISADFTTSYLGSDSIKLEGLGTYYANQCLVSSTTSRYRQTILSSIETDSVQIWYAPAIGVIAKYNSKNTLQDFRIADTSVSHITEILTHLDKH